MIEEIEEQRNISACVEVLASWKFDRNLLKQYLRRILCESLQYIRIILQERVHRGLQQGLQQGKCETVIRLLTRRIGIVKPELRSEIQQLNITQLD